MGSFVGRVLAALLLSASFGNPLLQGGKIFGQEPKQPPRLPVLEEIRGDTLPKRAPPAVVVESDATSELPEVIRTKRWTVVLPGEVLSRAEKSRLESDLDYAINIVETRLGAFKEPPNVIIVKDHQMPMKASGLATSRPRRVVLPLTSLTNRAVMRHELGHARGYELGEHLQRDRSSIWQEGFATLLEGLPGERYKQACSVMADVKTAPTLAKAREALARGGPSFGDDLYLTGWINAAYCYSIRGLKYSEILTLGDSALKEPAELWPELQFHLERVSIVQQELHFLRTNPKAELAYEHAVTLARAPLSRFDESRPKAHLEGDGKVRQKAAAYALALALHTSKRETSLEDITEWRPRDLPDFEECRKAALVTLLPGSLAREGTAKLLAAPRGIDAAALATLKRLGPIDTDAVAKLASGDEAAARLTATAWAVCFVKWARDGVSIDALRREPRHWPTTSEEIRELVRAAPGIAEKLEASLKR